MKYFAFVVLVALASAADEKKPELPELKPEEKPQPQRQGLVWPLPDPQSEGDLILHGAISFDRVQELHKQKVENEEDKMILSHGRQFLRRVLEFLEKKDGFKVHAVLCQDTRNLNGTNNRWEIDIPNEPTPDQHKPADRADKERVQKDEPAKKEKGEKAADDVPHNNNTSNETEISTPILTTVKPSPVEPSQETYETRRREFYDQVGANFARLLIREYRKEQLNHEETQYLARWNSEEAVHYGAVAIYCNEGENVREIKKKINTYLVEEKQ